LHKKLPLQVFSGEVVDDSGVEVHGEVPAEHVVNLAAVVERETADVKAAGRWLALEKCNFGKVNRRSFGTGLPDFFWYTKTRKHTK
jgi:hypothetical protein